MPYGVPNIDDDTLHPDDRERAEQFVRLWWPELRRRFYGAEEEMRRLEAAYQGAGIRARTANERTTEARRALERRSTEIFRNTGRPAAPEELLAETEELARAEASEVAARAEYEKAGPAMAGARAVFNRAAKALAKYASKGVKIRRKRVNIGRGNETELLAGNLGVQAENLRTAEVCRNAPKPPNVLKERVARQLDEFRGRDPFRVDSDGGWGQPVKALDAEHKLPGRVVTTDDLLPLLVTLFGDEIRQRLFDRIDRDHRDDTTLRLTAEEKKARLAKLQRELLDLQYVEGELRVLLAGDAPEIAFRPEMDPMAILGVEVVG